MSLWAPPTASTSSTGFSPTKTVANAAERPSLEAVRAVSQTAPRLHSAVRTFSVHSAPASPSGAVA
ncbi:MAG: hypothetical protein QOK19_734 [Solirubrobacteraceae bacterium]|nr:hypothetical protein [Solirubrobacterales bacterium]MEA2215173.1 hypothetical protein [Solirubrobacteraceae bacterium]